MTDLRSELLDRIDRALAVCEAATPGPWACYDVWDGGEDRVNAHRIGNAAGCGLQATSSADIGGSRADLAFIAFARTALPIVLRWMRAEVERHELKPCDSCMGGAHDCKQDGDAWPCRYLRDTAAALEEL